MAITPLALNSNKFKEKQANSGSAWGLGDYRWSDLTLAQFQALNGTGWVLADGGSSIGSDYHAFTGKVTVPDVRGTSLRAKDHGRGLDPAGDLAEGTYQDDNIQGHEHGGGSGTYIGTIGGGVLNYSLNAQHTGSWHSSGIIPDYIGSGTPRVSSETRTKGTTGNVFIKINY